VAGAVETEGVLGVQDADMTLDGTANGAPMPSMYDLTDANGDYMFPNALPLASSYTVAPEKNDNHGNGVSTFDLVLISRHILGLEPLNTPYKMIAADANNSKSITTFDIVELRKLILGIYNELPNNESWRFVDAAYQFPNPSNPFTATWPEAISVAAIQSSELDDNFVGVKVGDVNGSALPNNLVHADDRTAGTLLFDLEDRTVAQGEEVAVTFRAAEKVLGYQFTMNTAGLEVLDIASATENLTADNFAVFAADNALTTSFDGTTQSEFTVRFKATRAGKLSELLGVSSRITRAEAYSLNGDKLDVAFRFSGNTIAGVGFELYQNQPNPFVSKTLIGFHLPQAGEATLSVYDETGRLLYQTTGDFAKGYNALAIDRAQVNTAGMLYYKLEMGELSATKKMIQSK
jgi:hypothetical protein